EGFQSCSFDCRVGSQFHHSHVSRGPSCHPGRWAFPSPVGDPGCPLAVFPLTWRLKCAPTSPPLRQGLLPGSLTLFRCPPRPSSVSGGGISRHPPCPRAPSPHGGITSLGDPSHGPRLALPNRRRCYGLMLQTHP